MVVIGLLAVAAFGLASVLDAFERMVRWSRQHESWQLDEWFMAVLFLGGAFAVFSWRRWRDLKAEVVLRRKAEHSVDLLTGLLPICSQCKKIRDQTGDWQPVETYIRERSAAEFSHGFCPDCLVSLYPELLSPGAASDRAPDRQTR